MFGQQNTQDEPKTDDQTVQPTEVTAQSPVDDSSQFGAPESDAPSGQPDPSVPSADPAMDAGAAPEENHDDQADQPWQHPGTPLDSSAPISDVISPAGGFPKPTSFPAINPSSGGAPSSATATDDAPNELVDIKQQALQELSPLVDKIDQAPEDRFRTLMMMIQATDNDSLVPKAYEAAHGIEDEQLRAQALLDIVNEINYFTQPHES